MKKIVFYIIFLFLVFSFPLHNGYADTLPESSTKPIRIGYMICDSLEESRARFAPLTAWLHEKTGRQVKMIMGNTHEFEDLLKEKKIDFFHVNSIIAVLLKKKYHADLLAVDIRGRHGHKASGTIIARRDSRIKTIDDMRGTSMIFGPALAPFGYMAQYALLLEKGFDPEKDFSYYAIPAGSAKHDKVIYGVQFGAFDVGAAPRIDLDRMADAGIINMDDFNIIAESEAMPYCTIGVGADVDLALKEQITQLLLGLTEDDTALVDGEVLKVLKRMLIKGFAPAIDSEYDSIRENLRRCNMAPYRTF